MSKKKVTITKSTSMIINMVKKVNKVTGVTKGMTLTQRMVARVGASNITKGAKGDQREVKVERDPQPATIAASRVT